MALGLQLSQYKTLITITSYKGCDVHELNNLKPMNCEVLGYKIVYMPSHPFSNKSGGWVYLHRLIMENNLNRYLYSDEHVHHLDGNKHNNDINNLELLSKAVHAAKHHNGGTENKLCLQCNKQFTPEREDSKYCSLKCSSTSQTRIQWPSLDELQALVAKYPFTTVGKMLGVSDNAIRKHLKKCLAPNA